MATTASNAYDAQVLRRCVRDLTALSALSAAWSRSDVQEIAEGLGLVLSRCLSAAIVYVRVSALDGGVAVEAATTAQGSIVPERTREIANSLRGVLDSGASDQIATISNPVGPGTLRVVAIPLGYDGDCGVLVAGSRQVEFPSESDRLLLNVAANQAASVLQQRRSSERLRRSERELADFFDNATVGLHWVGPDGIILRANQAELNLLGYCSDEYIGHHIREFHADHDAIEDVLRRLRAGKDVHEYEARLVCKDGSIKNVLIDSSVLWDDGRFIHTRCFTRDITDRKRAEEALRDGQRRLREMIDALPAAIYTTDAEGRLTHFNQACVELSGRVPELGSDRWCVTWKLFHADGRPMPHDECPMAIALKEGRSVRGAEAIAERPDGTRVWFAPFPVPLRDVEGRVSGGINMLVDITERKQAERALAQSTAHLALATEAAQVGTWEWHIPTDEFVLSTIHKRFWGYDTNPGAIRYEDWLRVLDAVDVPQVEAAVEACRKGRHDFDVEYRLTPQGSQPQRWIRSLGRAEYDETGNAFLMRGVSLDITERKQIERALAEEAEVRQTLNHVGASLARELDPDKLVQAVTDAGTKLTTAEFGAFFYNVTNESGDAYMLYTLTGASKEAFVGFPNPRATALFGPTFRGEGVVRLDDVTQDRRYSGMPPGHLPVRSYLAVPVMSRSGRVLGGLFFGHSRAGVFSARHEQLASGVAAWAAIALDNARLYREAEDANRTKDEFLAILSHELRTPLNAMLGWAQLLRSGVMQPDVQKRALESLERNARAQAQLVEDLLDISRIISGKLSIKSEPVDLAVVVGAAVDIVRPGATSKQIRLGVAVERDSEILVTGDADRLQQVVWNLVSNAVKFTPTGGRVDVEVRRDESNAQIIVRDTGEGIDPAFLPYVFERFRQADNSRARKHGGLGLGLAIVRHLMESHGGTVRADSAGVGQGATFTLTLPIHAMASRTAGPAPDTGISADVVLTGARVLVVDDQHDARELVRYLLEERGAQVTTATSAGDALHELADRRFDVLVADIGMPEQDGISLIRAVRSLPDTRGGRMPAIAVTAYATVRERDEALRAGFNWHLAKPVEPDQLIAAVAAVRRGTWIATEVYQS